MMGNAGGAWDNAKKLCEKLGLKKTKICAQPPQCSESHSPWVESKAASRSFWPTASFKHEGLAKTQASVCCCRLFGVRAIVSRLRNHTGHAVAFWITSRCLCVARQGLYAGKAGGLFGSHHLSTVSATTHG